MVIVNYILLWTYTIYNNAMNYYKFNISIIIILYPIAYYRESLVLNSRAWNIRYV